MSQRLPGPMCTSQLGADWIDGGTMSRTRSVASSPTGSSSRIWELHQSGSDEGGIEQGDFAAVGGTAMCLLLTSLGYEEEAVQAVEMYFRANYPMAYDHLIAYLSGTGESPYDEPVEQLFTDNPRAAQRIADYIRRAGTSSGTWLGEDPVSAPIRQTDYSNSDWRLALGNIDEVRWQIISTPNADGFATVRISIRDPYHWSPGDDRFTDCFHELFERLGHQPARGSRVATPRARVYEARGIGDVSLRVR